MMEIRTYIAPLLKWWWLVVAAALIAASTSFISTRNLPLTYQSRTTLIIGQSLNNPNPSGSQFALEQQLALIYADMARREPIRRATMEALGLSSLPDYVARTLPDTQLIEITVSDTDPVRAQAVAAELADQLILRAPTNVDPEDEERQAFVNEQLADLQNDIEVTKGQIEDLNAELGGLSSAQQIADTERQLNALETKLRTLQSNYASLLANTQTGASNSLSVVEPAEIPTGPIGSNREVTVLLATALGGLLAVAGAFVIEAVDLTIKSVDDVTRLLNWPLMAEIPKLPAGRNASTYVADHPLSSVADAFRTLRTNLEVAGVGEETKTLLVTSAALGEGKSTVAANLALTSAKLGKQVILVDADFHRSSLGFDNQKGLSDLLVDGGHPAEHLSNWQHPTLHVLSNGTRPANLTELLGAPAVGRIFSQLTEIADLVIVDGPPIEVSDSLALSVKADGVLVVARLQRTRRIQLARAKAQLERARARVLGVAVNGVAMRASYYNGYFDEGRDQAPASRRSRAQQKRPAQPHGVSQELSTSGSLEPRSIDKPR
ncbi:MAG: polysaccharide biosynthesis tyrosine autokinase [Anaerolineales bacterium]|nr:polysaccharide biosynthesis tyrosine autokinase [Anaerolineales bacterium]